MMIDVPVIHPWLLASVVAAFMGLASLFFGGFILLLCISLRVLGVNLDTGRKGTELTERERVERAKIERAMAGKVIGR